MRIITAGPNLIILNGAESSESFTAVISSEVPMPGVMVSIIEPSVTIAIKDDDSKD